jgi:hypothetical protein
VPADWPESGQQQLRIAIDDADHEDLLIHMRTACEFIEKAVKDGGNVLIHSERGQSRSAAVAVAYSKRSSLGTLDFSNWADTWTVMWKYQTGATEALERVRGGEANIQSKRWSTSTN